MGGGFKAQVRLGDVRPSERNPRRDFGNIDALARSIESTGGEPVNPMVLVRDGNVYRIVDGERRFRALCQIHGEDDRVDALVFTDYGDAAAVVAMVATDDKMRLTPEEQATGFQQMMILDVDEDVAAKALGRDVDQVRRARRSLRAVADAVQTDLDALIIAGDEEFSEGERESIVNAGRGAHDCATPESKAAEIRKHHKALRKLESLKRASIEYHDGTLSDRSGYAVVGTCTNAKEADAIEAHGIGIFHAWWNHAYPAPSGWTVFRRLTEDEVAQATAEDDELEREAAERDRQLSLYKEARCEMMGWLLDSLGPFADARDAVPTACDAAVGSRRELYAERYGMDVIMVGREDDVIRSAPSWYEVVRWLDEALAGETWWSSPFNLGGWGAEKFAAAWDALAADGWEPPKSVVEVREACGKGKE